MAVILRGERLSFSYRPGQPVLREVSLSAEAGSVVFLLGHNGCGKTTLLEILGGLRTPQAGTVWLNGTNIHRLASRKRARRIGLVPQMHTPVFAYSVREVVLMGRTPHLNLFGTPGQHDRKIVDDAIDAVGLSALRDRPYTELSGGERQLALIARGLAQQTEVLLLDEPTAHLDPRNQALVLETISQLAGQRVAFVISSHNPNSALLYADRVIVMQAGHVVANGTPAAVLTEEILSRSYGMPFDVITSPDHTSWAVMPRRSAGSNGDGASQVFLPTSETGPVTQDRRRSDD